MSSKNWIKIKIGLSRDPKHREKMGNRVWLYMHIIDKADWETGIVYEWRDKEEAEDMCMPWRNLQRQRQELHDQGYIVCEQTDKGQKITIRKWTNPKSYSGEVLNSEQGYSKVSTGGTRQGTQRVSRKVRTPPYSHVPEDDEEDINNSGKEPPPPERGSRASKNGKVKPFPARVRKALEAANVFPVKISEMEALGISEAAIAGHIADGTKGSLLVYRLNNHIRPRSKVTRIGQRDSITCPDCYQYPCICEEERETTP